MFLPYKKRAVDFGTFTNKETFLAFLLNDTLSSFNSVFFKCDKEIAVFARNTLREMELKRCFSIKEQESSFYICFILENISKSALDNLSTHNSLWPIDKKSKSENTLKNEELKVDKANFLLKGKTSFCDLYPDSKQFRFCKVMFKIKSGRLVEWTSIIEKMNEGAEYDFENTQKDKKSLRDTIQRINKKIKNNFKTKENLFSFKGNYIIRNF